MSHSGETEKLAGFVVEASFDRFPEEVVAMSKKGFLDWIGVTLQASKARAPAILIDLAGELGGGERASILGCGKKTTVLNAALVNGTMSHVLDYDDAYEKTRNHTSAPLIAAILAVAESRGMSGRDMIAAYITGFEVSTRIGLALGRRYYENGWHATAVLGRFGAAAGAGRLLGLNLEQTINALGLAATQAGGIRSVFGTMGKSFHSGKAAMDGTLSAMLAQRGFTGPAGVLDKDSEFTKIFTSEYRAAHLTEGFYETYHILTNSFKRHAACLLLHPVIEGLMLIVDEWADRPEKIDLIELSVAPLCKAVTDRPCAYTGTEGKFSIQFCSALILTKRKAGHKEFDDSVVQTQGFKELMGKVHIKSSDTLKESEADIAVYTSRGTYAKHVSTFRGRPEGPLDFEDIAGKFTELSHDILPGKSIRAIVECVKNMESLAHAEDLVSLCCNR